MKTFGAVILNSITFTIIWFGSAFLVVAIAFRGHGDSVLAEYFRLGIAWFLCPGIGGYFAPRVTMRLIKGANLDSVISSFLTTISIFYILTIGLSLLATGTIFFGRSNWQFFQLVLQFIAMLIGTLMGKASLKEAIS